MEAKRKQTMRPLKSVHGYGSDRDLALIGPMIAASWRVPRALATELEEAGRELPEPVRGAVLIDTGASTTCISLRAARELGLRPSRVATAFGAHGAKETSIYRARLRISVRSGKGGRVRKLEYESDARGVKDLEKYADATELHHGEERVRLIGLLGRDLLRHVNLTYDGPAGEVTLRFHPTNDLTKSKVS